MESIVHEISFIDGSTGELESTVSCHLVIHPLPCVHCSIRGRVNPLSISTQNSISSFREYPLWKYNLNYDKVHL